MLASFCLVKLTSPNTISPRPDIYEMPKQVWIRSLKAQIQRWVGLRLVQFVESDYPKQSLEFLTLLLIPECFESFPS
jgi:hypothetical protein